MAFVFAQANAALRDCRRATAATRARSKTSTARIVKKIFPTDAIVATKFVLWPEKTQEPLLNERKDPSEPSFWK